ncbi:LOW QUALITY PROTEIN: hypothetical protein BRADI_1g39101v3 [Brachypodium distachyon]|uniref:Uncharacterized protein n=1 Tax=Brachypodium distachyon TaxID=15368 RepID=A0A2K2DNI8_BRADI|nr:LOW QUALITY PROTEIN: hypothetical protein BRADI_1g39101v3 [Brachypodium distachyon]
MAESPLALSPSSSPRPPLSRAPLRRAALPLPGRLSPTARAPIHVAAGPLWPSTPASSSGRHSSAAPLHHAGDPPARVLAIHRGAKLPAPLRPATPPATPSPAPLAPRAAQLLWPPSVSPPAPPPLAPRTSTSPHPAPPPLPQALPRLLPPGRLSSPKPLLARLPPQPKPAHLYAAQPAVQ